MKANAHTHSSEEGTMWLPRRLCGTQMRQRKAERAQTSCPYAARNPPNGQSRTCVSDRELLLCTSTAILLQGDRFPGWVEAAALFCFVALDDGRGLLDGLQEVGGSILASVAGQAPPTPTLPHPTKTPGIFDFGKAADDPALLPKAAGGSLLPQPKGS